MSGGDLDISSVQPVRATTPLPWLLLGLVMLTGIGISARMHNKWVNEKMQTALALKANDELMDRLRKATAENERLRTQAESFNKQKTAADTRQQNLEDQLRSASEENARFRSNPRCFASSNQSAKESLSRGK